MGINIFENIAIESMKSSGYALKDSICELIDNSLWHGKAKNVDIKISWHEATSKNSKPHIKELYVADNGTGMSVKEMEKSVKIGGSSTYGSTETFGRFGWGMISGAITQCNFIEIYSKNENGGDWNYIQYDVKRISSGEWKEIPNASVKSPPEKYTGIIENTGTIIIWSEFDTADKFDADWDITNARGRRKGDLGNLFWELGRIYRKSIGKEIVTHDEDETKSLPSLVVKNKDIREITLNGKNLIPMDPLYMLKIPNFEDDPKPHHIYDELNLSVPVHPADVERAGKETDNIRIRMTILNEKWRQQTENHQNPREREMQQRMIHRNEGISVLRQGREVSYGKVGNLTTSSTKTEDRYWGCEIDFPATLDKRFGIKNVKIGIDVDVDLNEVLKSALDGPIRDARRVVATTFKKSKSKAAKEANTTPHEEATGRFKDKDVGTNPKSEQLTDEEKRKQQQQLVDRFSSFGEIVDREKFGEIGVVFQDDIKLSENNPFVEMRSNLGNNIVIYNLNHPFFQHLDKVYSKLEELGTAETIEKLLGRPLTEEEEEFRVNYQKQVSNTRYLIDLLLGSVAAAKGDIDHDVKQMAGSTLNSLFSRWTDNLFTVANDKNFGRRIND